MEEFLERSTQFIEQSGWLAPLFFILLHVFRQIFFIPVLLVCLVGGYLFGTFYGSLYSMIGLTTVSLVFYGLIHLFPMMREKLGGLKKRFLKEQHRLTLPQMMIMRLIPFIHFHLVSLYLMETTRDLKSYVKKSFLVSIPPAIVYTAFGDMIHDLPLTGTIIFAIFMIILFLFFRKKRTNISWNDFFQPKNS
ncbi:TVP38/TMEM64 family protein [Halalkalibacter nanhaiisediminis]|uniref:TVP38/TMEM64 family membrane protein n=1 Tax=Halalkalibacter nanhaiisediminis TaxID=688079 RepID=A0A562QK15_9BACI|nr:TVP38/TMEM64 family protein [Halalkalibacter nanhaiisediminis]TWI57013.1 putative membrane protein YdjX (TVP38/TMEM64 family) [Halalkalibacter nanhaiisediminis]